VTTQDPGEASGKPDAESTKPDLRKSSDNGTSVPEQNPAPEQNPTVGLNKGSDTAAPEHDSSTRPLDLGRTFDYDATAQASLSEQPPTAETLGGATGTPGPGWDTYSGVGNGPGWGTTPSYPPPADHQSDYPPPGDYPYGEQGATGAGPVYGTPDPQYPIGSPPPGQPPQAPSGGPTPPPAYGQAPTGASPYGPPPGPPYGPPAGYGPASMYGFADPSAPYGRDPYTGEPYSDKSKVTAGVLEILLGAFGAGRFYLNQPGLAVAQIAVTWLTCGIGGIWPLIDGILMLTGKVRDEYGRPLRP